MIALTRENLPECVIGKAGTTGKDGAGWIAFFDGSQAALASYDCLGYDLWTALLGDASAGPGFEWEGDWPDLVAMAAQWVDPFDRNKLADGSDRNLMRVYEQIQEFAVNGQIAEDIQL